MWIKTNPRLYVPSLPAYVAFFTVPKVYETNKTQIDANLEVVSAKFQEFTNK